MSDPTSLIQACTDYTNQAHTKQSRNHGVPPAWFDWVVREAFLAGANAVAPFQAAKPSSNYVLTESVIKQGMTVEALFKDGWTWGTLVEHGHAVPVTDQLALAQVAARELGMAFLIDGVHVPAERVEIVSPPEGVGPIADMRAVVAEAKAALKELRDGGEVKALRQAMWEVFATTGGDTDGDATPDAISTADLIRSGVDAVKQLRGDYDEACRLTAAIAVTSVSHEEYLKFKGHSVLLNRVIWQMAERLGDVKAGESEISTDLEYTIQRFFSNSAPTLERYNYLLAAEHALSDSYVRIREIVGAMSPPSTDPVALYPYVEAMVKERCSEPFLKRHDKIRGRQFTGIIFDESASIETSENEARPVPPEVTTYTLHSFADAVVLRMIQHYRYGQFADDFDRPLAPTIRADIRAVCESFEQALMSTQSLQEKAREVGL